MTPLIIYIIGLLLLALLAFCFIYACDLYRKARELNPDRENREQILAQIATAQSSLHKAEEELTSKAAELAAANRNIAAAHEAEDYLKNNQGRVDSLKIDIKHVEDLLKDATDELNKKKGELIDIDKQLQTQAGQIQNLEIENRRLTQANLNLQGVEKTLEQRRILLKNLEDEIAQKKFDLHRLEEDIKGLVNEKERIQKEISSRTAERDMIVGDMEKKRAQFVDEIADLTSRRGNLLSVVKDEERRWVDLDDVKHVPNINIKNAALYEEDKWIAEFKENLAKSGLFFDNRIINAFHTGLKVADCSPMVVLAGISGTGKSLLPELYARAIGMNFLQVAVQPRWDSPQDMLGFYNYMEGSFKATELSRLLWQSDPYNNRKAKERAMNLVLLDEMNLARIEYYFSDMLSKLEVRRGINPENKYERAAAEIVIDCGYSKEVASTRRIFVGKNTLFVGTMNEDESTQSLSDKVVDRSNIIRFGRPSNLDLKPQKEAFYKRCTDRAMLPERWLASCKDGKTDPKLLGIMNNLNAELGNVGRPFAHRVWQSIRAYVANYPQGHFFDAVADQIEMKILPKLSGLDTSDTKVLTALNNIETIIADCRDDALSSAYKEALNTAKNATFFQWKGVTR